MKFRVMSHVVLPAVFVVLPAASLVVWLVLYDRQRRILEDQLAIRDRAAAALAEAQEREEARVRLMKIKADLRAKQRNFCETVKHGIAFDHQDTWRTVCVDPQGVLGTYYFEKDFK